MGAEGRSGGERGEGEREGGERRRGEEEGDDLLLFFVGADNVNNVPPPLFDAVVVFAILNFGGHVVVSS